MAHELDRRTALKLMAAAPLAVAAPRPRPNIVFILSDDHRYDAFGFMQPWLPTPNLDRLAREGVHFANAFVTTSLCSPSRASFLTGLYAGRHGVKNNVTTWQDRNVTFLELLKRSGYETGFIGKWHMPGKGLPDLVGQGKVDRMVSFTVAGGQGVYNDCPLVVDGKPVRGRGYITETLTDYALEFLRRRRDRPFCLYLSHKAVHFDFVPPPRYRDSLKDAPLRPLLPADKGLPLGAVCAAQELDFRRNQQRYYETLRGVDDSVGQVLGFLSESGIADDTMVVYAGDNGFMWGEHGLIDKRYAYEESIRIPLLCRYPRLCPGGTRVERMVLNVDLMPTLLEAAALETPAGIQGQSWLRAAAGEPGLGRESFLYQYFKDPGFPHPEVRAVRTRDRKYIVYPGSRYPEELYRLSDDPTESRNLARDAGAAGMRAELAEELRRLEAQLD